MTLDATTAGIIVLVLQIVQLALQTFVSYHSARKSSQAAQRREQREQLHQSVAFLANKHETLDARTMTLQQWMDILLTHKNLEHSSSGQNTQ